jgi:hypothetical protein
MCEKLFMHLTFWDSFHFGLKMTGDHLQTNIMS